MEELTINISKSALMEVGGARLMASLEMGHAWGKITAGKMEQEWDRSCNKMEMGVAGGIQPPSSDLPNVRRDGVWCMPHSAWGVDGKLT